MKNETLSTSQLCRSSCSSLRHLVNCRSFCSSSQSINQLSIFLLFESISRSIIDFLSVRRHQLISTISSSWSVETSLDKKKIEVTHNNLTSTISNKQINTQNIKQKIWISLRFASSVSVCLSTSTTFSEFATTTSESASMKFYYWRVCYINLSEFATTTSKAHALFSSILYIFAINTSLEDESITSQQRYESNDMKSERTKVNKNLSHSQLSSSSSQISVCSSARRQCVILSISTVNQNAPINKNWKSSNSRNLKQHTSAKSISLCLCFVLRIDRFIILICKYLRDQDSHSRFSFKILILVIAYIYSRLLAHLLLSHLSLHVYRICSESFSFNNDLSRYLRFSQWISLQCRSIEGMR